MSVLKELLMTEWGKEKNMLAELDVKNKEDSVAYSKQADRVEHLEKLLVDLEKKELDIDAAAGKLDIEEHVRCEQIRAESKSNKTRNAIEIAKIGVPVVAAFAMGLISMEWEKIDTLTSTAGKSALREVLRFKL